MKRYKIAYSGWNTVEVEANSPEEAEDKFWDDGLNDLYDAEIGDVVELEPRVWKVNGFYNDTKEKFEEYLVTDTDVEHLPKKYSDDQIFFYGLSERGLLGNHGDFTITQYQEEL